MSDSDAGDDGGIDKEALREELREKYERDERERKATQRMSDLLLKGATMTNAHCGTCGDPLFEQNGTTFCPSCHGSAEGVDGTPAVDESDAANVATGGDASAANASAAPDAASETSETNAAGTDANGRGPSAANDRPRSTGAGAPGTRPTGDTGRETPSSGGERPSNRVADDARRGERARGGRATSGGVDAPGDARSAVLQALERFSREAATADDPRYARECLEAAREAAETLAVLDR